MKPKFRSIVASAVPRSRACIAICASFCAVAPAHANQTWTGALGNLWTTPGNWSSATPGANENAVFNSSSIANLTIDTAANQAVGGLVLANPAGPVAINNNTLTLGVGGIDMSAATQGLTLGANISLLGATTQDWTIGSGASLVLNGTLGQAGGGARVDIDTTAGGSVNVPSGTASTMLGTYVTLNKSDFAGLNGSKDVVAGNTVATYAANPNTGAALPSTGTSFTYMDVINSNTNAISAFRLSGNTTLQGGGIRFGTPHANGQDWVVDINSRALYANDESHVLVASNINTNVIFNPSGLGFRSNTSGTNDVYATNFSAQDLIFRCSFSQAGGRNFRITRSGSGDVFFSGDVTASAGYLLNEGVTYVGENGTSGALNGGGIQVASGAILALNRSDSTYALGLAISGDGAVTHVGSGSITLSGTNTYTGGTNVTAGLIGASSVANFGTGTVNLNGGGIRFVAPFDVTATNVAIGSSGATFNTNGGDITFSNPFASGGTGSVTKSGTGNLTLAATNNYSGGTVVQAGGLIVSGTNATGSGAVTVSTGSSLSGTGSIAGTVDLAAGAILKPGASVGTLTVGGLDLNVGSTATFEFGTGNDQVTVSNSGGLTIDGGVISLVHEGTSTPFNTPGTYNLFAYSGSIGGTGVSALSVENPQPGFSYDFDTSGGFVTLTIATTGVVTDWAINGGGSWTTPGNWTSGIPNGTGATANFNVNLAAPSTVTLDGTKTVGAITFLSAANGYTIAQGSGGSLVLNNGGSDASILDGAGAHAISAPITLSSNVVVNTAGETDGITLGGVVSGGGNLAKTGPGSLALLGSNDFTGDVTLSGGTTVFANNGLGAGDLTISGAGLVWASGNTQDITGRVITFGVGSVTFDTNGNDVALTNSFGNSGTGSLVKNGEGRLTLASDSSYTGATSISGGVLQLGTGGAAGHVQGDIINNSSLVVNFANSSALNNLMSGTGSFEHAGSGILSLGAQNTYNGITTVASASGVLLLTDSLNVQNSTVHLASSGGSVDFGVLTAATFGGLSGNKNLVLENTDLTPTAVALTVGGNNQNSTYSGILGGSGSLIKLGTGIQILEGANTFIGNTTVSAGELQLNAGGQLFSATINTPADTTGFVHVLDGSITTSACTLGRMSGGLFLESGSVDVSGVLSAVGSTGSTNSAPIRVADGTLTASEVRLGRTGLNDTNEPAAAPIDTNLYLSGGSVNVSGNLYVGTYDGQPNSSVVTRVDGGILTVGGAVSVGLNNAGRWSYVDVNGGEFFSTATGVNSGLVLGGAYVGKSALLMRSGSATVERIQLGRDALGGTALVRVTGGDLYVGSEGILLGTSQTAVNDINRPVGENANDVFRYEIRLTGGNLAAKANWSTNLPVNLAGAGYAGIKTADSNGDPFDITINGAVAGSAGLDKYGAGVLTLAGGHSHSGPTTVFEGTLRVKTATFDDTVRVSVNASNGALLNLDYGGGDLVGVFEIDGAAQPDGIYGSLANTTPGIIKTAAITGTGLLYVNTTLPVSGYNTWASTNAGSQTANLDFDLDGVSNGVEYFMNAPAGFTSNPGLVGGTVTWTNGGNISHTAYGTEFVVQTSNNLSNWTDVLAGNPNLNNTAGSVSFTPTGPGPVFVRLKVTPN